MGLDRRQIEAVWIAATLGPISYAVTRELRQSISPDLPWIPLGLAGSAIGLAGSWLLLRRRHRALKGVEEHQQRSVGRSTAELADRLTLAFFVHDPCGAVLDDGRGAYAAEAAQIAGELPRLANESRLRSRIRELLLLAYSEPPAPGDESLHALAAEIWRVWQEWSAANPARR